MKNYSVALVYTKLHDGQIDICLRHLLTTAVNSNDALGIAITTFSNEMQNTLLSNNSVLEIL
jgi:hypothetical protein